MEQSHGGFDKFCSGELKVIFVRDVGVGVVVGGCVESDFRPKKWKGGAHEM
jgi:hypothetical protein